MRYLFDTNLCIAVMNGTASAYTLEMLRRFKVSGNEFLVSSVVLHELWYGVAKSQHAARNAANLRKFLTGPVSELAFSSEDGRVAGEIRAELERRGTPIGPYDLLIAGQALARDLTLITANTREFRRVSGLKLEDWS